MGKSISYFKHLEVLCVIKTDKNLQICDLQPRLGMMHTTYQGRPKTLLTEATVYNDFCEHLNNLPEEKVKELAVGNTERAKRFKIKI